MTRFERLHADQAPRLRALRLRALQNAPDAFGTTYEDAARWPAEMWVRQLENLVTFVAMEDGQDVGLVRCERDRHDPKTAWLISMWVAPEVRRTGVGRALVDLAILWARESGATRLVLDVADLNDAAIGLYESKGFKPTGEVGSLPSPREHVREHRRELAL